MNRAFLYIDILGFENLVRTRPEKVDQVFAIFDRLKVHKHPALQIIVFSDTIIVFNKDESRSLDYYCTYLVEYAQELFYKLSEINLYFKGILTFGEFKFSEMTNIQAYYGLALIEAYRGEKVLKGFGLYVDRELSKEIIDFDKVTATEKYDFILLCQSLKKLYTTTQGILPVDLDLLTETDSFHRIDEELRFFREVEYIKINHPSKRVRSKYQKVYNTYKLEFPLFFKIFEVEGFLPFTINTGYVGNIDPFNLLAEKELSKAKHKYTSRIIRYLMRIIYWRTPK
jgi:hypothetical protein